MIEIHAYAIVSSDDRIADADGRFPSSLMNEADWAYFQGELDRCHLTVLGRASHEATPNSRNRRRLIMSSRANGLEGRDDGWWWNPARASWSDVARELLPQGGRVGIPGGQVVFDYFVNQALNAFHLSRAHRATLPNGRGVFASVEDGVSAEDILRDAGFEPDPPRMMDAEAAVDLTIWRRLTPR